MLLVADWLAGSVLQMADGGQLCANGDAAADSVMQCNSLLSRPNRARTDADAEKGMGFLLFSSPQEA